VTSALAGRRVLLLRPESRSRRLLAALAALGATGQAVPITGTEPPGDPAAFDAALIDLAAGDFDWVGFTSVNAVRAVLDRAGRLDLNPMVPASTRIAAVGPATAEATHQGGLPVDLLPTGAGSATTLAAAWPAPVGEATVLLPRSESAADTLPDLLAAKGFRVSPIGAYRTVTMPLPATVAADLSSGGYDAVVLTAGSVVGALTGAPISPGTVVVTIGEATAAAARAAGLEPVTAAEPTDAGLLATLTGALEAAEEGRSR
jgi:uroporphyrinogen-III synthase